MGRASGGTTQAGGGGLRGRFGAAYAEAAVSRLWGKAYDAYQANNDQQAQEQWEQALERDPHCADALLGLHMLGVERPNLLADLLACVDHLGEQQQRMQHSIRSSYNPIAYQSIPLSDADDVHCARARELVLETHSEQAEKILQGADQDNPLVLALRAQIALNNGDAHRCVSLSQRALGYEHIESDVQLLLGRAYSSLQLHEPARLSLERAITIADSDGGRLAAQYNLALAYDAAGNYNQARRELEAIYSENADYADVAELLQTTSLTSASESVAAEEPEVEPQETEDAGTDSDFDFDAYSLLEEEPTTSPVSEERTPSPPLHETRPASASDSNWDDLVAALESEDIADSKYDA